ncbi:MAG TPA: polyphosphate kinase 1 [Longimicrobiales bacterium]|nr:polyphosphate kinase 1 [Longimicrobiales bacterium]
MSRRLNVPVSDEGALARLSLARHPLGVRASRPTFQVVRETYFDTADGALKDRRMALRLRAEGAGRQVIELSVAEGVNLSGIVDESVYETPVVGGGLYATLAGTSEVATRVRAVTESDALRPQLALDIDRESRELRDGLFGRTSHRIVFDEILAHAPGVTRAFQEMSIVEHGPGRVGLDALATRLSVAHGLENDGLGTYERVRGALLGDGDAARLAVSHDVRVVLVVLHDWSVALLDSRQGLTLPSSRGSGEELARECAREIRGDVVGDSLDIDLVGFTTPRTGESDLEVWLHEVATVGRRPEGFTWLPLPELMERIGGPRLRDTALVATLLLLVRSEIGARLLREAAPRRGIPQQLPLGARPAAAEPGEEPDDYLDLDLSILDFNQRVLEMAEDAGVPLLERFRFLSIFSSNLDEYFVVRVARLKDEAARGPSGEYGDLSPSRLLDLVAIRVRALVARQYACYNQSLFPALAEHGIRVRRWAELEAGQRAELTRRFSQDLFPLLTPLMLSSSSVRSFPRLASLGLALAAVLRRPGEGSTDLGYVAIPRDLPRLMPVPDSRDVIPVEEVVAANARELFSSEVQEVHAFRASRAADVEIDEDSSGSLLKAIADEVEERPFKPVIRLEVASAMPREVRSYLLKEIRGDQGAMGATITRADLYEIDGILDLRCVAELCESPVEGGVYQPYAASHPLEDDSSIFATLAARDVLLHHPFHDFDSTVGRFLAEAADDPDVVSIKLTLYRTGRRSPVMEALLRALESGKDVSVFVELKARFDEESNIEWTHRLKEAGAHVITGVPGYKTHAKTALVVRREAGGVRRYVHLGTGNYNSQTARFYTDLGLMSSDPDLGADLNDFFNELTGSESPPGKRFRRLLVAPTSLVQEIGRMIEREMDHAAAGRPARIQAKLNGLADREVVEALYRASRAGVRVDLIVRSICTLRPGVPGLSDHIHVRSILGRMLEHSRIYHFENAGQGEYYIGSADWRARNLRKRVEVVTPVDDPRARAVLRSVLDAQLADPRAWVLRADGVFERLMGEGPTCQEQFMTTSGGAEAILR